MCTFPALCIYFMHNLVHSQRAHRCIDWHETGANPLDDVAMMMSTLFTVHCPVAQLCSLWIAVGGDSLNTNTWTTWKPVCPIVYWHSTAVLIRTPNTRCIKSNKQSVTKAQKWPELRPNNGNNRDKRLRSAEWKQVLREEMIREAPVGRLFSILGSAQTGDRPGSFTNSQSVHFTHVLRVICTAQCRQPHACSH